MVEAWKFKCKYCKETFISKMLAVKHMAKHFDEMYRCNSEFEV